MTQKPKQTVTTSDPRTREVGTNTSTQSDEPQPFRPPGHEEGLGWARKRDINDSKSQQSAPRSGGQYDPTGEEEYAEGLDEFEEEGGAANDAVRADSSAQPAATKPGWELDEGGVQFERPDAVKKFARPDAAKNSETNTAKRNTDPPSRR